MPPVVAVWRRAPVDRPVAFGVPLPPYCHSSDVGSHYGAASPACCGLRLGLGVKVGVVEKGFDSVRVSLTWPVG
ncbi:hypothetical protein GUJ93_ZPchr0001g33044 [Zizania palustris]|uniref:Uncharacterized protein n=1 Tax=Zizania palustris TaxID=103762 RepID=A0A8J5RVI2_ZIZPA|nr:hypothetical protein GUJ93_ZPchr0001g33044 [Zizania palustris]